MGTTLDNLHIYFGDPLDQPTHEAAVKQIEAILKSLNQTPVSGRIAANRTFVVVSDDQSSWLSIYDSGFPPPLQGFPEELARVTEKPVLNISVYDSDALVLQLFESGVQRDSFCDWSNAPDLPKKMTGNAENWHSVLPQGVSSGDLASAWKAKQEDYPFESEGILGRVVDLLQLDAERAWRRGEEVDELAGARITRLFYDSPDVW
jgi:hypothetical protein